MERRNITTNDRRVKIRDSKKGKRGSENMKEKEEEKGGKEKKGSSIYSGKNKGKKGGRKSMKEKEAEKIVEKKRGLAEVPRKYEQKQ